MLMIQQKMDKFIKKRGNGRVESTTLDFQIIEWWAKDEVTDSGEDSDNSDDSDNNMSYSIYCFGRTADGKSITCKINNYYPFYYIKINGGGNTRTLQLFLTYIKNRLYKYSSGLNEDLCEIVKKKDLYGFRNDKYYTYVKLVFKNMYTMNKSKYIFKNPVTIDGLNSQPIKYKLYESNFEPFLRFCHIKDVQMANWVRVKNFKTNSYIGNADINIEINDAKHKNSFVPIENPSIANFLQASWDIEVYSFDGEFPEAKKKNNKGEYPNVIYQMATTFKYFNEKNLLVKHLLTLKKCSEIKGTDAEPVVVEYFSTETALIKRWIDLMKTMDPDIIYTYNGDSFDWMYLTQRCELLGIKDYLFKNISRLNTFEAEIKKEFFSSSAYGDNEYNRVYIPGRLNYDLMIHYKRGMKKYSSYKLDAIAGEILKESKHDVSAKEIFEYYKSGCPDKIQKIGKYCFTEGTRVSLPSCSVNIECLDKIDTDVVTWVYGKGFSTSKKTHFFNNGKKDCLELTLIDGTKIKCTKDHLFLTKSGWIEAQYLSEHDKILYYPEPAFCDYENEYLETYKFSDEIGVLNYEKACIFARILGYLLTDGCISNSTCYKNYSQGRIRYDYDTALVHMGTKIDAEAMLKDIYILTGRTLKMYKQKYTYCITLTAELTRWVLSIDGVINGKKINSACGLPEFVKRDDCPLWVIREFIKGLMGGDGGCPSVSDSSNKFSNVSFVQSKTYEYIDTLTTYMTDLQTLFSKFNIKTKISNTTKNGSGDGYSKCLKIVQSDMIAFYEKIGFAYCVGKTYKLAVASSYYKLRNETTRQFNWVCKRINILRKNNMTVKQAIKQAHSELNEQEPIFNDHYSLPQAESLNLAERPIVCKFNKNHFPSAIEYLKLTEAYDRFVTSSNKKSYAVGSDDEYSPCYYLSVLYKKDIGQQTVYDIEVKGTHNFVANGAVVHNCIQDTHLLQKLVDKQMILITIIQLANVTFVPIGYLVTRGQTIKVSSQILRKARQMDFLVPNTNFNEDNYPIKVKLRAGQDSSIFKVGDFLKLGIKATKSANSYNGNDQLNCKISEIVDESHVILLTSIELQNPYYNIKLYYKGSSIVVDKVWSINELLDDSFTGACVLEPVIGFTNDDVVVLDFASLYPTIIISRNLCYSTFVMDTQFENCKDTNYETIEWCDTVEYKLNHKCGALMKTGKKKNECCDKQAYFDVDGSYFCRVHDPLKKSRDANEKYQKKQVECCYKVVQPSYNEDGSVKHKGVLPTLLEELYAERKKVKKRMAKALEDGDKLLADILESTQLAIKVSLNSCYGFLGRRQGNMVLKELGSIVTAVGRQLIETSRDYAENEFLQYVMDNKVITQKIVPKEYNYTKEQKELLLKQFKMK
jgi:DNA polymerase elongation subunit (family B)/intein/homing endonuclease